MASGDKLALDIVTIERKVWEDDGIDLVLIPGIEGEMGVLPNHAPVLTALRPGVVKIKKGDNEEFFAVGGGFVDVNPKKVVILAQTAEHSEEIDLERAEAAYQRAKKVMEEEPDTSIGPSLTARAALARHVARLKVVRRRRGGTGGVPHRQQ